MLAEIVSEMRDAVMPQIDSVKGFAVDLLVGFLVVLSVFYSYDIGRNIFDMLTGRLSRAELRELADEWVEEAELRELQEGEDD